MSVFLKVNFHIFKSDWTDGQRLLHGCFGSRKVPGSLLSIPSKEVKLVSSICAGFRICSPHIISIFPGNFNFGVKPRLM